MTGLDPLLKRRSVLANDIVEPGPDRPTLERIVEAGLRVPDHGKLGPWRLKVLGKREQAALGDVFAAAYPGEKPEATAPMIETERQRPQRAPWLIVVLSRPVMGKIPEIEQRLSAGAVCINLLNAAHAAGFVGQWLTEWPAYNAEVKMALGCGPQDLVAGFVYIGSAKAPPKERGRPGPETAVESWPADWSVA